MYAQTATGNVEYFWNKPHTTLGHRRSEDVP
jgi:hypothetical protein